MAFPSLSSTNDLQTRRLLAWYLGIRLAVVVFFVGGTIIYHFKSASISPQYALIKWLAMLIFLAALQTLGSALMLRRIKSVALFIHATLTWDLLFVLVIIFLTGGVESLYSFLFILVVVASSFFLPRSQVLIVASAAAILYGSLLDLQYYDMLPLPSGMPAPTGFKPKDVFYAVFINVGAFFLAALLSGYLAERLRRSEAAREQREIDYGELEQLNRTILENINSGLMIVNPEGRIRSFNHSATKITGYALQDVYNRPVEIFFPPFSDVELSGPRSIDRGEATFLRKDGEQLTLGYSASRVEDAFGRLVGQLFAFQDLTEYKALEAQLKRADRLAAVGRLASGMAHEIRNPLASISGSVQLLMEDPQINEENRRLMGIVVREADRLNLLLSDFLDFAKPSPVQLDEINLASLVNELIDLLTASGQFADIVIDRDYREIVRLRVDRQKMRQALWDLLLNAAEAVQPQGRIRVSMDGARGLISIEDSGQGIAEEIRDNIFEPFFTTKDRGTGLGLANVYANIEAHGGRIYVEPGALGGARFNIELPEVCLV